MLRSMFAAVSGLRNHQVFLDVVGNNLANINTVGFKASRITFQDMLSQTTRGATAGGSNAVQIGLGSLLASVDTVQTQGNLQSTGKTSDMAVQGNGFFMVTDGSRRYYTRAGAFDVGLDGKLMSPESGMSVVGWQGVNGAVDITQPVSSITVPMGQGMVGQGTTKLTLKGNLDVSGTSLQSTVNVYDSLGKPHSINITFTKGTGTNTWSWLASTTETGVTLTPTTATDITFLATGIFDPVNAASTLTLALTNGANTPQSIALDMSGLTQLSGTAEVNASPDGAAAGSMVSFTIGGTGDVTGVYSNGVNLLLGRLAIATFTNPAGLVNSGNNLRETSPSSGEAVVGEPGSGGRGEISTGFMEMSNVDIALEFTNMIMAERGFQANSRIISASDELLQDLVNMNR